jgi:hypothetical protein
MTTINLTVPVANGPEIIRSISLRKIKMGDTPTLMAGMSAFATGNFALLGENILKILERLSGLPRRVIDEIDEADLEPVMEGITAHIAAHNALKN